MVYMRVINTAESQYFNLNLVLHCHFSNFFQKPEKLSKKLVGQTPP